MKKLWDRIGSICREGRNQPPSKPMNVNVLLANRLLIESAGRYESPTMVTRSIGYSQELISINGNGVVSKFGRPLFRLDEKGEATLVGACSTDSFQIKNAACTHILTIDDVFIRKHGKQLP